MSVKKTFTLSRILGAVSFSRVKSAVSFARIKSETAFSRVLLAASSSRAKVSDAVLGFFIDFLRFGDSASVSDQETKSFAKRPSDSASINDDSRKGVNKILGEVSTFAESVIAIITKPLTDSASTEDDTQVGVSKPASDTFTASDLLQPFQLGKKLEDTVRSTDDVGGVASIDDDQTIAFFKVTGDIAGTSDSLSRAAVFTREFTDDFATSDQHSIGYGRLPSESLNTADTATKEIGTNIVERLRYISGYKNNGNPIYAFGIPDEQFKDFGKAVFDGYGVDDSLTKSVSYNRAVFDTVNVTDDVNGAAIDDDQTISYFKNTVDTFSSDDNFARVVSYSRSASDSPVADDSLDRDISKPFTETSSVADLYVADFGKPVSDEINTADSFSKAVSYQRSPTDSVKATDDVNGAAVDDDQNIQFVKVTTDSSGASDDLSRAVSFQREFDDTSGVADQPSKAVAFTKTDSSSAQDLLSRVVSFVRSFTEQSTLGDNATKASGKLSEDSASADDSLSKVVTFSRSFDDTVKATDDVNGASVDDDQNIQFIKATTDSSGADDSFSAAVGYNRTLTDSGSAADDIKSIIVDKGVDDTGGADDAFRFAFSTTFTDTADADDSLSRVVSFSRSIADTVKATDDVNGASVDDDQNIQFIKVRSDSSSVDDSELKLLGKDLGDGAGASDSGSFVVQGYTVDNTYFASDYVGTTGSF